MIFPKKSRLRHGLNREFWRDTPLDKLDTEQWEALCDGCAKCCLHKLEDVETGEILFTNVACRLLDPKTGRCRHYAHRAHLIRDCVQLTPATLSTLNWLPSTCAYRLLAQGEELPWWHPLVSGDPATVKRSGNSVCGRTVSETDTDDLEQHLIQWVR
jgi:uncharacterized cysteine cluster protein YcgN (CxxCxxCC family)